MTIVDWAIVVVAVVLVGANVGAAGPHAGLESASAVSVGPSSDGACRVGKFKSVNQAETMPHPVRPFPAVALLGFMDEAGANQYASGLFLTRAKTPAGVKRLWRYHSRAVSALSPLTPADEPAIGAPDPALAAYLSTVQADPMFQAVYGTSTWQFADVEIAPLLAFQPHVEIGRYETNPGVTGLATSEARAMFCLPVSPGEELVVSEDSDPSGRVAAITISSSRPNVWFHGFQRQPGPALVWGFLVTGRPNFAAVAAYRGRYYVKNGYHRLVSLLRMGFTSATVVLEEVPTWGEVGSRPGFFPETLMVGPRPPMLRDFLDISLAHRGRVRPVMTILRVAYTEQQVPML